MELFLDREEKIKEAAFVARLSEAPENWPQELQSEMLKQLPFLSDYELSVTLDRVDSARGFGFGYADISNKTERPELEHPETGLPHIRIPVVIHERGVKPFSIFLDGEKVIPLTEDRIREALFNPATFDLSTIQPRDPSLIEPFMPPHRSGIGMGGEYKMASAKQDNHEGAKKALSGAVLGAGLGSAIADAKVRGVSGEITAKVLKDRFGGSTTIEGYEHLKNLVHKEGLKKYLPKHMAIGGGVGLAAGLAAHHLNKKKKKHASVLAAIAPTIRESDAQAFVEKVASDYDLQSAIRHMGMEKLLIDVFENTKRASAEDRMLALMDSITPTCMTFQKLPGGDFLVKSANVHAFIQKHAEGEVVPGQEAAQAIGPQNAQAMQPGQTATATANPVEQPQMQEPTALSSRARVIEEFGQYKVQDMMGNQLMGHVFPEMLAWDGSFGPQKVALFTNGSVYAMQDAVAGELVGKGTNLPSETPRGDGVFYSIRSDGEAVATMPVTVASAMMGPDQIKRFSCSDSFGNQFQILLTPGMKSPQRVSDAEYALPDDWRFMRLNEQTQLVPDPTQMNKSAAARDIGSSVTVFWNGAYNLEGGCGLPKIAQSLRYDLDPVSAEFMLGVLGVDGSTAKQKLAECRKKGSIKLAGLHTIQPISERFSTAEKTASAIMEALPDLRRDLIKEAAQTGDADTADSLLALNFINPENLATFVSLIPQLQETGEKLAEMLLMSYLGQQELPEEPIDRAMKNLEQVIAGLKAVAQAEA
jgi:hypothetical protein